MKAYVFVWLCAIVIFSGCIKGNGKIETRTFSLDDFDEVHLKVDANVYLQQGPTRTIIITGEENILNKVRTDVDDSEWEIEFTRNVKEHEKLEIYITLPDFDKLRVSGSGGIIGLDRLVVDDLDIDISGSGFVEVELTADELDNRISGSGEIRLTGTANHNDIEISGSGNVRTFGLESSTADINISGSGNAQVNALNDLIVRISGSGNVSYRGNPDTDIAITGSGSVNQVP